MSAIRCFNSSASAITVLSTLPLSTTRVRVLSVRITGTAAVLMTVSLMKVPMMLSSTCSSSVSTLLSL